MRANIGPSQRSKELTYRGQKPRTVPRESFDIEKIAYAIFIFFEIMFGGHRVMCQRMMGTNPDDEIGASFEADSESQ